MYDYLNLIDTETGGNRCDVTPLFANPVAFARLIRDLSLPYLITPFDYVAGIDALGFIIGAALSAHLNKGFIPIRKGGRLPAATVAETFVDYTGQQKTLELRRGIIKRGQRVLVVDEWIETGAQVQAAANLIEKEGGIVIGIATINMDSNERTTVLREKYSIHALILDK
jgi:adenine phosphoribosyltransferase